MENELLGNGRNSFPVHPLFLSKQKLKKMTWRRQVNSIAALRFEPRLIVGLRFGLVVQVSRVSGDASHNRELPFNSPAICCECCGDRACFGVTPKPARETRALPNPSTIGRPAEEAKKFFAASEKVPILRVSASVA
jgi:hypothetical protein